MENSMAVTQPNEVSVADPIKPTVPEVSLDPMDFQKEIQKIAREQGMEIRDGNVVPVQAEGSQEQTQTQAVSQPVPPQAEPQPGVPDKFQTKDGGIDLEKVQKSTVNAEQALAKYLEKERELRKLQSSVNRLEQTTQNQFPQTQQMPQFQPQAITPEQINKALEDTKNPGKVLLELQALTFQSALAQARAEAAIEVSGLRDKVEAQQRQAELQKIADKDPWVFSEQGISELSTRRSAKPWLNQAPEPWLAAYRDYIADREIQKPGSQVQMTNPTAQTVRAPAPPVYAGNRTQTPQPSLSQLADNPAELNRFLDGLPNEAARKAFWQSILPGANRGV